MWVVGMDISSKAICSHAPGLGTGRWMCHRCCARKKKLQRTTVASDKALLRATAGLLVASFQKEVAWLPDGRSCLAT